MDTFERRAARNLAVSYNAYLEASLAHQPIERIRVWARLLLQSQRETGIELIPVDRLLYPAGDAALLNSSIAIERDAVEGAELAAVIRGASAGPINDREAEADAFFDARDQDGGALVPSPKPQPRKPSPGASVASQAAKFYARNSKAERDTMRAMWKAED